MFTDKLPLSNKVSQRWLSLSEINISTLGDISLNPGLIQKDHLKEN